MKQFKLPKDGGIKLDNMPDSLVHACDKIFTNLYEEETDAVEVISERIKKLLDEFQAQNPDKLFKLGFSSGTSLLGLFIRLGEMCAKGEISFKGVEIFFTDEYCADGINEDNLRSRYFHRELLDKIDIIPANVHIPDGTLKRDELASFCADFDLKANGMDLLVLGIGEEGQVAFNEKGTQRYSRTRSVLLSYNSRKRQALNFGGDIAKTPKLAVTMGMQTIFSAKKIYVVAWGEDKAGIVSKIVEDHLDTSCPASLLRFHQDIALFVDENAGSLLTREVAPWLLGPCEWTPKFRRKAVIWLS